MELGNQWFLTYKPFEYREDERAPWLLRLINAPVRMVLGLVMNALASMYVLAVMPTFVKKVLMMLGFFITRLIPFIWMFVELCVYKIFRCFSETTVHTVFLIGILLIAMLVSKIIMFLAALMYCLVIFFVDNPMTSIFHFTEEMTLNKYLIMMKDCVTTSVACATVAIIPLALFVPELVSLILITPLLLLRPVQELIIEPACALIWFAYAVVCSDVRELKDPAIKLDDSQESSKSADLKHQKREEHMGFDSTQVLQELFANDEDMEFGSRQVLQKSRANDDGRCSPVSI